MRIRIKNFPTFVKSKGDYCKDCVVVNDTKWFIVLNLKKFCQTEKKFIDVTPSSNDQPEALGACIFGKRDDEKDSSFIVNATFTFKRPSTAKVFRIWATRFDLNSTNDFHQGCGVRAIATIDVIYLQHLEIFQFSDRIS